MLTGMHAALPRAPPPWARGRKFNADCRDHCWQGAGSIPRTGSRCSRAFPTAPRPAARTASALRRPPSALDGRQGNHSLWPANAAGPALERTRPAAARSRLPPPLINNNPHRRTVETASFSMCGRQRRTAPTAR